MVDSTLGMYFMVYMQGKNSVCSKKEKVYFHPHHHRQPISLRLAV